MKVCSSCPRVSRFRDGNVNCIMTTWNRSILHVLSFCKGYRRKWPSFQSLDQIFMWDDKGSLRFSPIPYRNVVFEHLWPFWKRRPNLHWCDIILKPESNLQLPIFTLQIRSPAMKHWKISESTCIFQYIATCPVALPISLHRKWKSKRQA